MWLGLLRVKILRMLLVLRVVLGCLMSCIILFFCVMRGMYIFMILILVKVWLVCMWVLFFIEYFMSLLGDGVWSWVGLFFCFSR